MREGLTVKKRDGRIEEFDRKKIMSGLRRACEKRPIQAEQIEMLVNDIVIELEGDFDQAVPTDVVGERVMRRLKKIDKIAYVRFASVYKDFRDIEEMEKEISDLKNAD